MMILDSGLLFWATLYKEQHDSGKFKSSRVALR